MKEQLQEMSDYIDLITPMCLRFQQAMKVDKQDINEEDLKILFLGFKEYRKSLE